MVHIKKDMLSFFGLVFCPISKNSDLLQVNDLNIKIIYIDFEANRIPLRLQAPHITEIEERRTKNDILANNFIIHNSKTRIRQLVQINIMYPFFIKYIFPVHCDFN